MSTILQASTVGFARAMRCGRHDPATALTVSGHGDDAPVEASGRTQRAGGTLGRRLGIVVSTAAVAFAIGLGGAPAASADGLSLDIYPEGIEWTYLGQYWVVASDGFYYLADAWNPPVGGARYYCWAGTAECWWEQHPWRMP